MGFLEQWRHRRNVKRLRTKLRSILKQSISKVAYYDDIYHNKIVRDWRDDFKFAVFVVEKIYGFLFPPGSLEKVICQAETNFKEEIKLSRDNYVCKRTYDGPDPDETYSPELLQEAIQKARTESGNLKSFTQKPYRRKDRSHEFITDILTDLGCSERQSWWLARSHSYDYLDPSIKELADLDTYLNNRGIY